MTTGGASIGRLRDRVLAWPLLDHLLRRGLAHPRALQLAGIVMGIAMVLLTMRPIIWPAERTPASSRATQPVRAEMLLAPPDRLPGDSDAEVLNVVATYNQASITAAVLGQADAMAPYLAPDSTAWAEVQAEYARRAGRGEAHDPTLIRWGVLRIALTGDTAIIETQEQWDDLTSVGGQVVASRRGILTRNTYTLRRSTSLDRWLITNVTTTTLIS
jgi:hypothetical protein